MPRLYEYAPSGNCYKVRLLLTQLGLAFERVPVDIQGGETRRPEFLRRNPNGRVPVLELEDGTCLAESNAILWYLAEGSAFLPDTRLERARALQWMFFEQYSHEPYIATSRNWISYAKTAGEHAAELARFKPRGYAALDVMESHLAAQPWFAGERYSVADIALYAYTHVAHEGDFDLSGYAALRRWLARVAAQPRHLGITV